MEACGQEMESKQEIWTILEPRLELSHEIPFNAHTVIYF